MKHILVLIVSIGFLLSCNQTKSHKEIAHTNDSLDQFVDTLTKTVRLSAQPETLKLSALPDSLRVIMRNHTKDTLMSGLHYHIEKLEAGEWSAVSPNDIAFNDLGWRLRPNDTANFEKTLYKDRVDYKPGKYRIVKSYLKSDYQKTKAQYHIFADFYITD